jgi:hypothetical protein
LSVLAPVTFVPDVAAALTAPFAGNPNSTRMNGALVVTADPDITPAVPAMIPANPNPVAMSPRRDRNNFDRARGRRSDPDNDLGVRSTCREENCSSGGEKILSYVH